MTREITPLDQLLATSTQLANHLQKDPACADVGALIGLLVSLVDTRNTMLRQLEWSTDGYTNHGNHEYYCPDCLGSVSSGHRKGCMLKQIVSQ